MRKNLVSRSGMPAVMKGFGPAIAQVARHHRQALGARRLAPFLILRVRWHSHPGIEEASPRRRGEGGTGWLLAGITRGHATVPVGGP